MHTKHDPLRVPLRAAMADILKSVAKKEHKTIPALVGELLLEALEKREDQFFSNLAEERDSRHHHYVSHDKAWR